MKENKDWGLGTLLEVIDRIASYADPLGSKTQGAIWLDIGEIIIVLQLEKSFNDLSYAKLMTRHGIVYVWKPYASRKVTSLAT